jgi:hypothetical protein
LSLPVAPYRVAASNDRCGWREPHDFVDLSDLADTIRVKRGGPLQHLKSYEVDGMVLRTRHTQLR